MLLEIPLLAIANQRVGINLNSQGVTFNVYVRGEYLFVDMYLGDLLVIGGARAVHGSYINQYLITGFVGYLFFYCDSALDPKASELGISAHLYYSDTDILGQKLANYLAKGSVQGREF